MKTFTAALGALALAASLGLCGGGALAQKRGAPPGAPEGGSDASQLVGRLDRTVLPAARVGLNRDGDAIRNPITYEYEGDTLAERFVFSQGFRVSKYDGCTLTLRNEDVRLLRYADNSLLTIGGDGRHPLDDVGRPGTRYAAELRVPLHLLSDRKGRAPYRHTRDPEQAALLGSWRATYRTRGEGWLRKGGRHVSLQIFPAERPEERRYVDGDMLTFTFDDKGAADNFNAAFRRAIKACK